MKEVLLIPQNLPKHTHERKWEREREKARESVKIVMKKKKKRYHKALSEIKRVVSSKQSANERWAYIEVM